MTPEQAVNKMISDGVVFPYEGATELAHGLILDCVATAKKNETRRCAEMVRQEQYWKLARNLLTSGGLEPEE